MSQSAETTLKTLSLPMTNVTRIVKAAIPDGVSVSKDTKEGFCKAMGIFILAVASAYVSFSRVVLEKKKNNENDVYIQVK